MSVENEAEVYYIKDLISEGWLDQRTWERYYNQVPILIYGDPPWVSRADGEKYAPEEWKKIKEVINARRQSLGVNQSEGYCESPGSPEESRCSRSQVIPPCEWGFSGNS